MTEDQRPRGISRRTVTTAAAWSLPVIALAATAPAAAATVLVYSITAGESQGPSDSGPGTNWVIYVENTGTGIIPAGMLSVTIPTPADAEYFFSGFSGSGGWSEKIYGPGDDGNTRTLSYPSALLPRFNPNGSQNDPYAGQLLLYFYKVPLARADTPVAYIQIAAPPAASIVYPLSIPY